MKAEALRLFFYHLDPHDDLSTSYAYSNRNKKDWEKVKTGIRTLVCDLMSSEMVQNHFVQILRTRFSDLSTPDNLITHYERSLDEFIVTLRSSPLFVRPGSDVITLNNLKDLLWQSFVGLHMPKENFRILCDKLEKDDGTDLAILHKDAFISKGRLRICTAPEYIDERGEVFRDGQSVAFVNNNQRFSGNNNANIGQGNVASGPSASVKGSGYTNKDYILPDGACPNCSLKVCKFKENCNKIPYCGKHDIFGSHNVGNCIWSKNSTETTGQTSNRGNFRGGSRGRGRNRGNRGGNRGGQSQPPGSYAVAPVEQQNQAPDYAGYYPDQQRAGHTAPITTPPHQGPSPQQEDQNFRS